MKADLHPVHSKEQGITFRHMRVCIKMKREKTRINLTLSHKILYEKGEVRYSNFIPIKKTQMVFKNLFGSLIFFLLPFPIALFLYTEDVANMVRVL